MAYAYEIPVTIANGRRIDAEVHGHLIRTDQPRGSGGQGNDPSPFDLFLASIGTCAGHAVQKFCAPRGIASEGISLTERVAFDDDGDLCDVTIEVHLPRAFPDKHADALLQAVQECQVERVIRTQPVFLVTRDRQDT